MVAIGMCFCLHRANRLLPNGLNFALQPTGFRRSRSRTGAASFPDDDMEAQQGLLDDDDMSDAEDEAYRRRQTAMERDQQEFDEFGELQEAPIQPNVQNKPDVTPEQPVTKPNIFSIQNDEESESEDRDR